jgi:glutamine synthetase
MLLPAAIRYLGDLTQTASGLAASGVSSAGIASTIAGVSKLVDALVPALGHLVEQNAELGGDDVESKAHHMRDHIIPAMAEVRAIADRLEKLVPDDLWPLPSYRDMLFVK